MREQLLTREHRRHLHPDPPDVPVHHPSRTTQENASGSSELCPARGSGRAACAPCRERSPGVSARGVDPRRIYRLPRWPGSRGGRAGGRPVKRNREQRGREALVAGGLGAAGVDQQHLEPAHLQQLAQRDPVHVRALHRHRLHAFGRQPVGQFPQLPCRGSERAHVGLAVRSRRPARPMLAAGQIDPATCGQGTCKTSRRPGGCFCFMLFLLVLSIRSPRPGLAMRWKADAGESLHASLASE